MNGSRYYGVRVEGAKYGVGFGSALAIAISYTNNHSILWAIIDGISRLDLRRSFSRFSDEERKRQLFFSGQRRRAAADEEAIVEQQRDADIDRRVGDVEYVEMIAESVQLEKIDDGAIGETIDAVAERAADDRAQADARPILLPTRHSQAQSNTVAARVRPSNIQRPLSVPCGNRLKEMPGLKRKHEIEEGRHRDPVVLAICRPCSSQSFEA